MSRNGSGGYSLPSNSWNPAVNGVSATAADWQALINDVATAIQQSISADGQTPITGNLQMGGNKLTGLAAGSGTGQSLRFEQLFSQGTIADIASAATLDIGAQLTSFLRVTGATGVTSFGTNYNGPRFLIFAGAVLLTHSATLVLPGAANITTAANDALIAIPISGGWQVVAYTKAAGIPAVAGPLSSSGITGAAASGANSDITSLTALTAGGLPDNSVLTADIANAQVTPAKLSQPFTAGTAVATTSGTSHDFTGIPTWVKRITVIFNGVSTNGSTNLLIQVGAGSFVTSGYVSTASINSTNVTATAGFLATASIINTNVLSGSVVLSHMGSNTWVISALLGSSVGTIGAQVSTGVLAVGGTLDRLRLTTASGSEVFDAGSINILYE
jgi:hypothetical protein